MREPTVLGLRPTRVAFALGIAAAAMVLATITGKAMREVWHVGRPYWLLRPFDVNGEGNVWTWFSSTLHLIVGVLCAAIARGRGRAGGPDVVRWGFLALLFVVVSIDETAAMHEEAIEPLRDALGTSGLLYNAWVVPAAVFVAGVAVLYLPFLRRLPRDVAIWLCCAAALFVGGALGVELLTGDFKETHGTEGFTFGVLTAIEESLEAAGLILFVYALLVLAARERSVCSD